MTSTATPSLPITPHAPLHLIADPPGPDGYTACRWDLTKMDRQRTYWLSLFRRHFPSLIQEALAVAEHEGEDLADARRRAQAAQEEFFAYLDAEEASPGTHGRLDILEICYVRERVLRAHAFADPYRLAKQRENEQALKVLPRVLRELDAMSAAERDEEIVRGVFAGNIFDMGATKTNDLFQNGRGVDFHQVRHQLKPRPWLVDDLDDWLPRLRSTPYRSALLFVDNAGPDIGLGMIPFARELVRRGTAVILAANTYPSLNDVTAAELEAFLACVGEIDGVIRDATDDGRLRVLADGNGAPLIDLAKLDPAFVQEVRRAQIDLLVLQGMGRAVESNFHARFTCDTLKTAMIKDEGVAEAMNGSLYDLVLRFETP